MNAVLGLLIISLVPALGDLDINITGSMKESVLLPCSCPQRNTNKSFHWQKEKPQTEPVFRREDNSSTFGSSYKDRVCLNNSDNCSLLLTNLTKNDSGQYKCVFYVVEMYESQLVNLNVLEGQYNLSRNGTTQPPNISGHNGNVSNNNMPSNFLSCNEVRGPEPVANPANPRTHFAYVPFIAVGLCIVLGCLFKLSRDNDRSGS